MYLFYSLYRLKTGLMHNCTTVQREQPTDAFANFIFLLLCLFFFCQEKQTKKLKIISLSKKIVQLKAVVPFTTMKTEFPQIS